MSLLFFFFVIIGVLHYSFVFSLSNRFVSEEEREAKYNRVVSSSISALGKLMSVTSEKNRAEMEELFLNILHQNKFWKYSKHKSPNVHILFLLFTCSLPPRFHLFIYVFYSLILCVHLQQGKAH